MKHTDKTLKNPNRNKGSESIGSDQQVSKKPNWRRALSYSRRRGSLFGAGNARLTLFPSPSSY